MTALTATKEQLVVAKAALETAVPCLRFAFEEIGVYPQSVVGGDSPYSERTPEMNEHNEKVTKLIETLKQAREALGKINFVNCTCAVTAPIGSHAATCPAKIV